MCLSFVCMCMSLSLSISFLQFHLSLLCLSALFSCRLLAYSRVFINFIIISYPNTNNIVSYQFLKRRKFCSCPLYGLIFYSHPKCLCDRVLSLESKPCSKVSQSLKIWVKYLYENATSIFYSFRSNIFIPSIYRPSNIHTIYHLGIISIHLLPIDIHKTEAPKKPKFRVWRLCVSFLFSFDSKFQNCTNKY